MQKPLTEKRLENIALFYLERFETSTEKLRQVLNRRAKRQKMLGIPLNPDIDQWIENVIKKMEKQGFVNNARYTENTVRRMSNQGKSLRLIGQKLKAEGIDPNIIQEQMDVYDDLANAKIFVKKKHLTQNEKDLAKLARAGFDYETAKRALLEQGEDDD